MRTLPVLFLMASLLLAEEESVLVKLQPRKGGAPFPRMPVLIREFGLDERPPPGVEPLEEATEAARYARVKLGGRAVDLALEGRAGTAVLGLLYSDRDGDGALDATKPYRGQATPLQGRLVIRFDDVQCGPIRVRIELAYRNGVFAAARAVQGEHRSGRTRLGGAERTLYLLDADGDGEYDGKKDRWIVVRLKPGERNDQEVRWSDAFFPEEPYIPYLQDGRSFTVRDIDKSGLSARLVLGTPSVSMKDVLARRYEEVRRGYWKTFLHEQATFRRDWGLDRDRATVAKPVAWPLMTLSAAQEKAKAEKKPLLAHYFTESTVWSFRYEFYTFRDKEVDDLLRKFVLVKIDAEKDPEKSYLKSGAGRWPTLLPMTSGGEQLMFQLRVRDKSGKTEDLDHEHAIVGWQRPQELVLNLRRFLKVAGR